VTQVVDIGTVMGQGARMDTMVAALAGIVAVVVGTLILAALGSIGSVELALCVAVGCGVAVAVHRHRRATRGSSGG
jgi:hypothetical protein